MLIWAMPDFLFGVSGKLQHWLVERRSLSSREQTCPVCVAGLGWGAGSHFLLGYWMCWVFLCTCSYWFVVQEESVWLLSQMFVSADPAQHTGLGSHEQRVQTPSSRWAAVRVQWHFGTGGQCHAAWQWQTVMALLLPLSYPSFGCNSWPWKQ